MIYLIWGINEYCSSKQDTINESYIGQYNHPPPYSIEPEIDFTLRNEDSGATTDNTENEPNASNNKQTTSSKNILGETLGRLRRNGDNGQGGGFGFQRFE